MIGHAATRRFSWRRVDDDARRHAERDLAGDGWMDGLATALQLAALASFPPFLWLVTRKQLAACSNSFISVRLF
jgi:hypothetical protein